MSCALYGDDYAFIGFYIVRDDLRGQGIGSPPFERAPARAGSRVVGRDGGWRSSRTSAAASSSLTARSLANHRWRRTARGTGGAVLGPSEQLLEYDAGVFGDGTRAVPPRMDRPSARARAGLRGDGRSVGYGVLRPGRVGAKVGPLFADDEDVAGSFSRASPRPRV